MAIYEREETYINSTTFYDSAGTLVDPDAIVITIKSPCGTVLVDEQAMAQSGTGVYTYSYDLSSDAIFGQYDVIVKATKDSDVTIKPEKFWVMPWNIQEEVRSLTGMSTKKISDDDLSYMVWNSYIEVRDRVMELHYREKLCCCVDGICSCCGNIECDCICGTSSPTTCTKWKLNNYPIADFNNDNNIHGCECDDASEECQNDICVMWKDSNGECTDGAVKVEHSDCGEITVYQYDCVTAIPSNNEGIFVTYRSTWKTFTMPKFKKAVAYLAAYELAVRYNLVSKVVPGCNEHAKVSFTKMLWSRYQVIIDSITKPSFGGID